MQVMQVMQVMHVMQVIQAMQVMQVRQVILTFLIFIIYHLKVNFKVLQFFNLVVYFKLLIEGLKRHQHEFISVPCFNFILFPFIVINQFSLTIMLRYSLSFFLFTISFD